MYVTFFGIYLILSEMDTILTALILHLYFYFKILEPYIFNYPTHLRIPRKKYGKTSIV